MKIDVTVRPTVPEINARLARSREAMGALNGPLARSSVFLDQWVQRNIRSEGGSVGGWRPFKAGGRRVKGLLDTSAKLLQDTGRLRSSFSPFVRGGDAGIGSDLPYASSHEFGNEAKGLPARRMLPKHGDVQQDINAIFRAHVAQVTRDHGK